MSDEKVTDEMKQEIRTRMQSLAMPVPKVASEFYTAEEMVSKLRSSTRSLSPARMSRLFRNSSKSRKR
jgi:hypothetical protein